MKLLSFFTYFFLLISYIPIYAQNIAIVNGRAITKSKLDKLMMLSKQKNNPEIRDRIRDMLIVRTIIHQEAINRGLMENDLIQEQLEQARLNILATALFENFIMQDGVLDDELKKVYDQVDGREYLVSHILLPSKSKAIEIIKRIKSGEKFDNLAKMYSKDSNSAINGGSLNWRNPQDLVPSFSHRMQTLKKGQITEFPVQSQFGWHIIRVDDMRDIKKLFTLKELKPQLIQILAQDPNWQRVKFNEMLMKLKNKAKIQ